MGLSIDELTERDISKTIDHSLLRPELDDAFVEDGCRLAARYDVASVCVRPVDVVRARRLLDGTEVAVGTKHRRPGDQLQEPKDLKQRVVPVHQSLRPLRLEIEERHAGNVVPESTHIRRVQVEHAPALFAMPCHDRECKEGGHDVTEAILKALRGGQTRFEGDHACQGRVGEGEDAYRERLKRRPDGADA